MSEYVLPTAEALPDAMTKRKQWVCWRREDRNDKPTKVPINPTSGLYASATDPTTWGSFLTAREYASTHDIGVGFVFREDDPLVGVDLDDCRDPETGALDADAAEIVSRLDSFTEVSPSGTGVHVIVRGSLPEGRNRRENVELYDDARFFTVTGERLEQSPSVARIRPDAIATVHTRFVAVSPAARSSNGGSHQQTTPPTVSGSELSDTELLSRAKAAANGEKFDRLWGGSTAGYPSHSEADMALCSILAFWTGGDADQLDRLFRESGLLRPKWDDIHFSDGATYGERTVERAITGTSEFYTGSSDEREPSKQSSQSVESASSTQSITDQDSSTDAIRSSEESLQVLRAEIDALEAENDRLNEELLEERSRRQEAEAQLADQSEGLGARILPWLSSC